VPHFGLETVNIRLLRCILAGDGLGVAAGPDG
jgi:hypothetical protein